MAEPDDRPPRRLPWWGYAGVGILAVLGAVWVVKIVLGLLWTIIEVLVIAAIVLLVAAILRARRAARRPPRARNRAGR